MVLASSVLELVHGGGGGGGQNDSPLGTNISENALGFKSHQVILKEN